MIRVVQNLNPSSSQTIVKTLPAILAVSSALLLSGCDKPSTEPPPPQPIANASPAAPVPATAATADSQKLLGRWLRPDGGYVLELKSVAPDGKLTASYNNPSPINISQAEVRKEAGALKVFVELRDQNYPGCTYTLTYDPEHDVLAGVYFQAMMGEKFDVAFERMKPGQ